MKECLYQKFILNGDVVDCDRFHLGLINNGTSIYEVIRFMKGRFLFAEDHLERLQNSVQLAHLDPWYTRDEIAGMILRLPQLNHIEEGNVKIVFNFLNSKKNHFLAYFVPHRYPEPGEYRNGVKVITYPFIRDDPNKKIWRPQFRADVNAITRKRNIFEVLLVDTSGFITEASKANFFTIRNGSVLTPPTTKVLPGITRKYVLDICAQQHITVVEKEIHKDELKEFDAVFLSGTSAGVLPVSGIDHLKFSVEDRVLRMLMSQFEKLVEEQQGQNRESK